MKILPNVQKDHLCLFAFNTIPLNSKQILWHLTCETSLFLIRYSNSSLSCFSSSNFFYLFLVIKVFLLTKILKTFPTEEERESHGHATAICQKKKKTQICHERTQLDSIKIICRKMNCNLQALVFFISVLPDKITRMLVAIRYIHAFILQMNFSLLFWMNDSISAI